MKLKCSQVSCWNHKIAFLLHLHLWPLICHPHLDSFVFLSSAFAIELGQCPWPPPVSQKTPTSSWAQALHYFLLLDHSSCCWVAVSRSWSHSRCLSSEWTPHTAVSTRPHCFMLVKKLSLAWAAASAGRIQTIFRVPKTGLTPLEWPSDNCVVCHKNH